MENTNIILTEASPQRRKNKDGIIDFHTHILPGIDDGSRDVSESLEMLTSLRDSGVGTVVFTPHFYPDHATLDEFLKKRKAAYEKLLPHLDSFDMDVRLGAEVYFYNGMSKSSSIADFKIEGTSYILVEMPFYKWSEQVLNDIIELNSHQDVQVVIAHIDRYLKFIPVKVLEALSRQGIFFQMNIDAMGFWSRARKLKKLLSNNMIQFFGSDTHNMTVRAPKWEEFKKYNLKPCIDKI